MNRKQVKSVLKTTVKAGVAISAVLYPFFIYFGIKRFDPVWLAVFIGCFFTLKGISAFRNKKVRENVISNFPLIPVLIIALMIGIVATGKEVLFLFIPAVINTGLISAFAYSLIRPPSIIERFAKMSGTDLSDEELDYCRNLTFVWIAFFLFNITLSVITALFCTKEIWTLYNGLIAYILIGVIFTAELTYRHYRFRKYTGMITDPLFKAVFPPHDERRSNDKS